MTIDDIKEILERLNFPKRQISGQTAICIMALLDETRRSGLLPGHKKLSDGARIHDILSFSREDIGKKVAENTRESYRKTSLAPLMNCGIVVRHQLSTNDPNTYYRLHPDFERLFSEIPGEAQARLIESLRIKSTRTRDYGTRKAGHNGEVSVALGGGESFSLSPGSHNHLEKAVAEIFGRAYLEQPEVVYLGDTAPRKGFQNRGLMRRLNLPIDTAVSLPDVILCSELQKQLVIVEVVTSSGVMNTMRLEQLRRFAKGPRRLGYIISYVTAFPSRGIFRRFIEEIAWKSSVWIESEPNNIVHFEEIGKEN